MSSENVKTECPIGFSKCLVAECKHWNKKCTYRIKNSSILTMIKDEWKSKSYQRKFSTILMIFSLAFLIIAIWSYIIGDMYAFNMNTSTCAFIGMIGFCEHLEALKLEEKSRVKEKKV